MSENVFITRRKRFLDSLEENSFALLASGEAMHKTLDQFFPYVPNRNFYYLTGLKRENFILFLAKKDKNYLSYIFIEEASDYANKWFGRRLTKAEVSEASGIEERYILYIEEFEGFLSNKILSDSRQSLLGIIPERVYLDLFRYKKMHKPISYLHFKSLLDNFPELLIKDANSIIADLRRVKDATEIEAIKQAISYTKIGLEALYKAAKPGINEAYLESLFEFTIKSIGAQGVSFDSIIASSKNATILHYIENDKIISDGSLVLLDLGAISGLYPSDISRTFPINGKFTQRQKAFYRLVLSVNKATIERIKPGVFVKELNDFAKEELAKGMIDLEIIKDKTEIDKYYYHGVSHYLGLDVHDVGTYSKPLEAGCVLTVEPGIYVEEEGIGIRIEDDILVTDSGYINLSNDLIKEIEDIEAIMKR